MKYSGSGLAATADARQKNIYLEQADAYRLPHPDAIFDKAISINVGCNLSKLEPHFQEIYRVLKAGGEVIITAPNSLAILFTDGKTNPETVKSQLKEIFTEDPALEPKGALNKLKHIWRGIFIVKEGKPVLVTDEKQLFPGQEIFRVIPGLTVPNYYHHVDEYLQAAKTAGFEIVKNMQPSFASETERLTYNQSQPSDQQLGPEYVDHPTFATLVFKKV